jgi:dihydroorotate dehydrogenase (fumarate)
MGLELDHPIVASAGPLSTDLDGIRRLEDGGAAAIVLFSLFEEQIRREAETVEQLLSLGTESVAESLSYFPELPDFRVGPERYLELVRRAREAAEVPIIASLNGASEGGWVEYAALLEQAGAFALELNLHFVPTDDRQSGRDVEERCLSIVRAVRSRISVPLAVKVGPFFSAWAHMAKQLVLAGANGLVVFNRFCEPDFDVERREVVPHLKLSTPDEMRLPLLWISILYGRNEASLAGSTGVETPTDAVKYLMAGADVVMTTSALLRHGPTHLGSLRDGLREWLDTRGYASVAQLRGSMSQRKVSDPSVFERVNYVQAIETHHGYGTGGHA